MVESSGKLRIFISWSLPLAGEVAKILRNWIPRLIQDVEPWVSSQDIEKGKFWHREVIEGLQGSTVGIVVVTPANVDRPWPNFEAGAMARAIEPAGGVVMPLLINMRGSNISGPMGSLQVTRFEKNDFYQLVEAINARIRYPLSDEILQEEFSSKWDNLRAQVEKVIGEAVDEDPAENTAPPARPETDVLEDLVATVRELRQDVKAITPYSTADSGALFDGEAYSRVRDILDACGLEPFSFRPGPELIDGSTALRIVIQRASRDSQERLLNIRRALEEIEGIRRFTPEVRFGNARLSTSKSSNIEI